MTAHVRANPKQPADLESLKLEIATDVAEQLKEYLAGLMAEAGAVQTDRSVTGFCKRWGISRFLFYDKLTEMPATMHVGGRTLISPEAEALWVKEREAAAKIAPKRIVGKARTVRLAYQEDQSPPK
jgi:hypothetical protein